MSILDRLLGPDGAKLARLRLERERRARRVHERYRRLTAARPRAARGNEVNFWRWLCQVVGRPVAEVCWRVARRPGRGA